MADGMNDVRALRLAELTQDLRTLQHYISQIKVEAPPEETDGQGYAILRQCAAEGQAVLQAPFTTTPESPEGNPEIEKLHLKHVNLDVSVRRFQSQRIFLRSTAAMRWVNSRNAILGDQRPGAAHARQLAQIDNQLEAELAQITDESVYQELAAADQRLARWTVEDPPLEALQERMRAQ